MDETQDLSFQLTRVMEDARDTFFNTVPYASHLTDETSALDETYYVRHRVETVKRIWLTAKTDFLALAQLLSLDYGAARSWGQYAVEEMNHDRLFLHDLSRHGVDRARVLSIPTFKATKNLTGFLEAEIAEGRPTSAIAYSLFVEWNSERYSSAAVDKAERSLSRKHVVGTRAHLAIDAQESHYDLVLKIATRILNQSSAPAELLVNQVRIIGKLLLDYFVELYDTDNSAEGLSLDLPIVATRVAAARDSTSALGLYATQECLARAFMGSLACS